MRTAREARGLTQQQLALALGVSFQQIQKYEKGANRMSVGRLAHIAIAVGIPIEAVFETALGGISVSPTQQDQRMFTTDVEWEQLRAIWADLQPSVRSNLVALARAFAMR